MLRPGRPAPIRHVLVLASVVGTLINCAGTATHAQAIGDFKLNLGFTFRDRSADSESVLRSRRLQVGSTVFLDPDWSLHGSANTLVSMDHSDIGRRTGIGDTELGVSGPLFSYQKLRLTFDYTIKLPTGNDKKGLSSGHLDHIAALSAAVDVNDYFNLSTDVGDYLLATGDQGRRHYLFMAGYLSLLLDPDGKREIDGELDYMPSAHGDPADLALVLSARFRVRRVNSKRQHTWTLVPGLSKGLLDSSSRWGGFVTLLYANQRHTDTEVLLARVSAGRGAGMIQTRWR